MSAPVHTKGAARWSNPTPMPRDHPQTEATSREELVRRRD